MRRSSPGTSTRSGSTPSSTRRRWSGTMSPGAEGLKARVSPPSVDSSPFDEAYMKVTNRVVSPPSVDSSRGTKLLPSVLSVIAGSVDVISFLGLGGLFTAHITGNLVILAAHVVSGGTAPLAPMLSVPVFMVVLGLTRLLVGGLEAIGLASLRPLLLLQFLLLAGFLVLCVAAGPRLDPNTATAIVAGMLGVAAMAVQNALVQISLTGAPSTAVMTTNVTHFMMDIGAVLLGRDPDEVAKARRRAKHT